MFYGKRDNQSDEDDDEDTIRAATNEAVDMEVEKAELGIRVLGLIPIKPSNDPTKKSLFFFIHNTDVLGYIRGQLLRIFRLQTCPSGIEAFATTILLLLMTYTNYI